MKPSLAFDYFEADYLEFETLDSTNEEARRRLQSGLLERPLLIRAHTQTAGRGTRGRTWASPKGAGLYFSLVQPMDAVSSEFTKASALYTLAAGVACAESIAQLSGIDIQLKPVNDLYFNQRKLGGILVESLMVGSQCLGLITGIGINILQSSEVDAACAQDPNRNQPISLQEIIPPVLFQQWHPEAVALDLCKAIAQQVQQRYHQLHCGDANAILEPYQAFLMPGYKLPTLPHP